MLVTGEMPTHAHNTTSFTMTNATTGGSSHVDVFHAGSGTFGPTYATDNQGGGGAHNNMHPFAVVTFIIKT